MKTKSLEHIEEKMEDMDKDSLRYQILDSVKKFKTSWIELGQSLYTAWKDKLYKAWGYGNFDIYTSKEIGIKKQTAMKLLRSYYFLEKEEPEFAKGEHGESANPALLPSYEAVDVLRRAKNKKLDTNDYSRLRDKVLEGGRDVSEVKKDLTALIRERQELDPEEARKKREIATVRRFLSTMKTFKKDIEILKLLPAGVIKEINSLIKKIEDEIGR